MDGHQMASYLFYLLKTAFYLKYVYCTRFNSMYRAVLSIWRFGGTRCSAVVWGECARILLPVCTAQAHSEKKVTADKNIATFSASKQDSQPYLFLTWKSQLRHWDECIYLNSIEQKTNILWQFFVEGKWNILRTACIYNIL